MKHKTFFVIIALAAFLLPAIASAQTEARSMRLHLDANFIDLGVGERHPEPDVPDQDMHWVSAVFAPPIYAGFSYAVINKLFIGLRLGLAYQHGGDPDWSVFSLSFLPYFEYIFLNGVVRPFVTATIGLTTNIYGEGADWFMIGMYLAGGGGAHFFIGKHFSIDLTGLVGLYLGGGHMDNVPETMDNFFDIAFRFSILVGLSCCL